MKKLLIALTILLPFLLGGRTLLADGYSINPGIKEFTMNPGEIELNRIKFKSNEKKDTVITATVETYDPKTEQILNKKPLVSLKDDQFTVKAGMEINIEYALAVPEDTPVGSYFNIITVTEKRGSSSQGSSVSVKKAVGAIVAVHVVESQKSIESIFFDQGQTLLNVTNKGLPFISSTQFEYTYENKSNFVFKPEGEIRVIDQTGKQIAQRFEINPEKRAVYPGEKYSEKFELEPWTAQNALETKDIIARTYSGYGDNSITDKVTISLRNSLYAVIATAAVLVIFLIVLAVRAVSGKLKSKKS
jgi:hypothetical protein